MILRGGRAKRATSSSAARRSGRGMERPSKASAAGRGTIVDPAWLRVLLSRTFSAHGTSPVVRVHLRPRCFRLLGAGRVVDIGPMTTLGECSGRKRHRGGAQDD